MIKIVNSTEGARIRELSEFKQMLSDEYTFNLNIRQTKFLYEQFFRGGTTTERIENLRLLNITLGLPALICEKLADFVGVPQMPYEADVFEQVSSFSWAGYAVIKAKLEDGNFKLENADPEGYIKHDDGAEQLLTFIEHENEDGKKEDYVFEQFYRFGSIQNSLYKLKPAYLANDTAFYGEVVSLDEIPATRGIPEMESTALRDRNPVVVVHNAKLGSSRKYGRSEIKRIRSMLTSIETQVINIQDQLLKHLAAILAVPYSKLPVDDQGYVDKKKLDIIGMEAGDSAPVYVTNTNPLIDKSFELIEKLILQIGALLSIPVEFFNVKASGGVEAAEAKSIRLSPFLKKVQRVRSQFNKGFEEVHQIAIKWGSSETEELKVMWDEIFPVDKQQEANELSVAQESGLISRKRAIMRYQNLDEEAAEQEKAEIDAERATVSEGELMV